MSKFTVVVDPVYNPDLKSKITSGTKLGKSTSMATFLGSIGNPTSIDYMVDQETRLAAARHLYLHSILVDMFNSSAQFINHRLIVTESLYNPLQSETVTEEKANALKQTGQVVVYQVINKKGEVDNAATFDLAVFWKDYARFHRLTLDYDVFDPDGKMNSQLVVEMPEIDETYTATFRNKIDTYFNGRPQARNEFAELL